MREETGLTYSDQEIQRVRALVISIQGSEF